MEQILPFEDPEDPFDDPITAANDLYQSGKVEEAFQMMEKLLVADLRCLDAHAHLGNWDFFDAHGPESFFMMTAIKHFEVGVRIGEQSQPEGENIVLSWGRIDNRPFLRCLDGYALSLWRMGEVKEVRRQLERMLWLNPSDNQGARFNLLDIDEGRSWEESQD
jgi:tetratricopeptide (TPR) repeat protein